MAMTLDGSASVTINNGAVLGITSGTAVASTSGTSIDFTSIPSWVKRITVMFNGVSTNGSSIVLIQIGTSSGIQNTSYVSGAWTGNTTTTAQTTGFTTAGLGSAAYILRGNAMLCLADSSGGIWTYSSMFYQDGASTMCFGGGTKSLSGTLDRVRITTVNGTDAFDAGSVNIMYEG